MINNGRFAAHMLALQLHQILPPLLSILLTSSLPNNPPTLRGSAAEILRALLQQHGATYPSLSERLTKTLLLSLFEPDKDHGTREGAVRGLNSLGDQGIRKGLIESGGAKMLGEEYGDTDEGITQAVLVRSDYHNHLLLCRAEFLLGTTRGP